MATRAVGLWANSGSFLQFSFPACFYEALNSAAMPSYIGIGTMIELELALAHIVECSALNSLHLLSLIKTKFFRVGSSNPNWHEAGHFPPHVLFGSDFVS